MRRTSNIRSVSIALRKQARARWQVRARRRFRAHRRGIALIDLSMAVLLIGILAAWRRRGFSMRSIRIAACRRRESWRPT